jgi:acetoin utilization protein AcuB
MEDLFRVDRWMSRAVQTVGPEAFLIDAFDLMRAHHIRHVPVVERGRVVGIVSDRDVRHAMPMRPPEQDLTEFTHARSLRRTPVSMAMTPDPLTIAPDASIHEAAAAICREKIGALPVVDREGALVGIISAEDLLCAYRECFARERRPG